MVTADEKWQIICPECKFKFSSQNKENCPKCSILIEEMVNPTVLHYIYYHCTKRVNPNCTQRSILADDLKNDADEKLKKVNISDFFKEWAIKYLNKRNDEEFGHYDATVSSLQSAHKDCVAELKNLTKLKISPQNSDGLMMPDDEYREQKLTLLKQKKDLEKAMKAAGVMIGKWIDEAEEKFDFAVCARYKFATGKPEVKREILTTIGSNLKLKDKKLTLDLENPYCFLEEIVEEEPTTSQMFEPEKEGFTPSQLEALWAQNPSVLRSPRLNIIAEIAKSKADEQKNNRIDYPQIIHAFQDLRYIGELKQRWQEIKKLQLNQSIALTN